VFIRYKRIGKNLYAYQIRTYWDPKTRKVRHEERYLGKVIDKERRKFEKVLYQKHREKAILDFGDIYLLSQMYTRCGLKRVVRKVFGGAANVLEVLVFNRIVNPLPMKSVYYWASGTWLSQTHDLSELESQRISEVLEAVGEESKLRDFFVAYLGVFRRSGNFLYDITPLPTSMTGWPRGWGYSDSGVDFQVKLALLIDKDFRVPLYFRLLPGALPDVGALLTTLREAENLGLRANLLVLDRGFFSASNLSALRRNRVDFILPVPTNNLIFKRLVQKHRRVERPKNAFEFNGRVLFGVKDRAGGLWAYVILDPQRRVRELQGVYAEYLAEELPETRLERELTRKGFMVLLSTQEMSVAGALSLYYAREFAERCFRYCKTDLAILPLRRHKEATLSGYLLVNFLALVLYLQLRETKLELSIDEAFLVLRRVKRKIYEDAEVTTELTKEQKEVLKAFEVMVPK
jgi:transposase